MGITVDTSMAPRRLRFTIAGLWPTDAEQRDMHQTLLSAGHLTPATTALIDCRAITSPGFDLVESMAEIGTEDNAWPTVCAFLIESPVQYGMCRQLQALAPPTTVSAIFNDEREALAWLDTQDA